jgi:uracil-DNA glycosylase
MGVFPFGRPVTACQPVATGERRVLVLGAYPSALHVRWRPAAESGRLVRALAVDNEPEPFWNGDDEAERVDAWREAVGWHEKWGSVQPVGELNGSSGRWVDANVFAPLGAERSEVWITDCLDTYRSSPGMRTAVESVYQPFASTVGLPPEDLAPHPSEGEIVTEATSHHRVRLLAEIAQARPVVVVTLGNAALRVLRHLLDEPTGPTKLAIDGYGASIDVSITGEQATWLPLAHPAAPAPYQQAHIEWMDGLPGACSECEA